MATTAPVVVTPPPLVKAGKGGKYVAWSGVIQAEEENTKKKGGKGYKGKNDNQKGKNGKNANLPEDFQALTYTYKAPPMQAPQVNSDTASLAAMDVDQQGAVPQEKTYLPGQEQNLLTASKLDATLAQLVQLGKDAVSAKDSLTFKKAKQAVKNQNRKDRQAETAKLARQTEQLDRIKEGSNAPNNAKHEKNRRKKEKRKAKAAESKGKGDGKKGNAKSSGSNGPKKEASRTPSRSRSNSSTRSTAKAPRTETPPPVTAGMEVVGTGASSSNAEQPARTLVAAFHPQVMPRFREDSKINRDQMDALYPLVDALLDAEGENQLTGQQLMWFGYQLQSIALLGATLPNPIPPVSIAEAVKKLKARDDAKKEKDKEADLAKMD